MRLLMKPGAHLGVRLPAAMEGLWLAAILLIPIIIAPQDSMIFHYQLPKIVLLRGMVSLLAVLWLLRWLSTPALPISTDGAAISLGWPAFKRWTAAQPVRLVSVGVLTFVFLNVLSTMFSVSPGVSAWGGFKAPDGYGLHNVVVFAVLFLVIARNLTTRAQVWRLLAAVAASGGMVALIGVLQRFDVAAAGATSAGVAGSVDGVTSTIGDPLALGAYLVLTIPIAVGLAVTRISRTFSFGEQALWILLISVQMMALAFTSNLGAGVGLIAALATFLALGYIVMERSAAISITAVTAIAVSLALLGMSFAPDLPEPANPERASQSFDETEFLGLPVEPRDSFLSDRPEVWAASAGLIVSRPSLPSQGETMPGLRFIFGYGPETFAYVFPLIATEDLGLHDGPRNAFIQRTVELGLLGGLATLALYAAAIVVAVWLVHRHRNGITSDHRMVLVLLTAALFGRMAQQMLGVGGVSDTMLFWVLLALIPAAFRAWPISSDLSDTQPFGLGDNPVSRGRPMVLQGARVALTLLLVAVMGWLITDKGINLVRADAVAARAQMVDATDQSRDEALALFDEAIDLAPQVPNYYRMRGDYLVAVTETAPRGLESNADLEEIYTDRVMALRTDPLAGESLLDMANIAFDLTRAGYEGLDAKAEDQYRQLMALSPNFSESHSLLWVLLAVAYMDAGQLERSLDFLNSALALNSSDFSHSKALFVQGAAYSELGQYDKSIESLSRLLEINADPDVTMQAHRLLANVYSDAGEPQLASDQYEQYVVMRDSGQG